MERKVLYTHFRGRCLAFKYTKKVSCYDHEWYLINRKHFPVPAPEALITHSAICVGPVIGVSKNVTQTYPKKG